jgi:predicted membrane protein
MSTRKHSFWPGVILVILGVLFLLDTLEVSSFSHVVRTYWPLILIMVGIALLLKSQRDWMTTGTSTPQGEGSQGVETSADVISESSVFGNIFVKPTSKNFRGGSISAVFGNLELNLASMELAPGEQHLAVHGVFGGVRVTLPKDVGLMVRGNCLFGEVTVLNQNRGGIGTEILHKSDNYDASERKLNITASQVFGDLRIW